ncbi:MULTISPECIES: hypothetical protein [unclassified Pseudomonas]|uniref:hypothetical protein n=1 Tax=unclassified Pseudomonas TaxID=196821 RepID=UPI00131BA866|nr:MULTISPECIES: hypothetical protein [unclassified Pseudomonas]
MSGATDDLTREIWTHVVLGFDDQPAPIDSRALASFEDEALAKQFLHILTDYQARQPDPNNLEALREWVARHPCAPVAGLFNRFELHRVPHLQAAPPEAT